MSKLALLSMVSLLPLFLNAARAADSPAAKPRSAPMESTFASGSYYPTRGAVLELRYDENGLPLSLTLTADGQKLTAPVWDREESSCGDRIYARLAVPDERTATNLELLDYSGARCRIFVKHKWHAFVDKQEADGSQSRLELEGNPAN